MPNSQVINTCICTHGQGPHRVLPTCRGSTLPRQRGLLGVAGALCTSVHHPEARKSASPHTAQQRTHHYISGCIRGREDRFPNVCNRWSHDSRCAMSCEILWSTDETGLDQIQSGRIESLDHTCPQVGGWTSSREGLMAGSWRRSLCCADCDRARRTFSHPRVVHYMVFFRARWARMGSVHPRRR